MYVVDRDFGFAPNPFHGYCTLATCVYRIRSVATIDDWVIGMGGRRLCATGRCIYAMRVTNKITFNEYWNDPVYLDKKPVRNGSNKMMVGDNIYHCDAGGNWCQADSHHSKNDGGVNHDNLKKDTGSDKVLISNHFFYFGNQAPVVPREFMNAIGFVNRQGHRTFDFNKCAELIKWLESSFGQLLNTVMADPFDFSDSHGRYAGRGSKIIK